MRRELYSLAGVSVVALLIAAFGLTAFGWIIAAAGHDRHPKAPGVEVVAAAPPLRQRPAPLAFAHRGAPTQLPENTLESFRRAFEQGADMLELDLVATKDHVLVVRHESMLALTTDVAAHPEFAGLRSTKQFESGPVTDWFVEDFTLSQIKQLHTVERQPDRRPGVARYDGQFAVPTLQEVLDLLKDEQRLTKRRLGVAVELKQRSLYARAGVDLEELLASELRANGMAGVDSPVLVISFSEASLRATRKLVDNPLCLLVSPPTRIDLAATREFADAIAIEKSYLRPLFTGPAGIAAVRAGRDLVSQAHNLRLEVYVHLLAADRVTLPLPAAAYRKADPQGAAAALAEVRAYLGIGVDGIISDNAELVRRAVDTR